MMESNLYKEFKKELEKFYDAGYDLEDYTMEPTSRHVFTDLEITDEGAEVEIDEVIEMEFIQKASVYVKAMKESAEWLIEMDPLDAWLYEKFNDAENKYGQIIDDLRDYVNDEEMVYLAQHRDQLLNLADEIIERLGGKEYV